jgi:cytochrome c oxidase assembly protein Cox11
MSELVAPISEYGRIESTVSLYIGGIFVLIAFIASIYLIIYEDSHYSNKTTATVTKASCTITKQDGQTCYISFQYNIDGKMYKNQVQSSKSYNKGDTITIYYNTKSPSDSSISVHMLKNIGYIMMVACIIIMAGLFANYYIAKKSKTGAFIEGSSNIIQNVKTLF